MQVPFLRREGDPLQQLEQLKKAAADARLPFDKDTWLNVAFFLDEQYVEWHADSNAIRQIPRQEGYENTPRPVANKIMHFVAQEHAFALKNKPSVDVLPATEDPVDVYMTAPALAYLRWLGEPEVGNWDETLSEATMWALLSEGYIKWFFNDREGRPDFCAVSPLDLYIDPYTKQFSKARYVIHSQFMDVEQVYDMFGVEVEPSDMERVDPVKATLLRDIGAAPVLHGVTVNELWMKPNRRYPDGLFAVWTNKRMLVEPRAFPYEHKRLPFTQLGSIPRPGTPHYTSAVKFMRSLQMELNKYHAQKIQTRDAFANLKWWIPAELELERPPDDSPRQILTGNSQGGALKPEILAPDAMPDNRDGEWISAEMMHAVGLHEVSQAQVPGRVEAAKAIELLKESDADRLAELMRTTKSAIANGYWQLLMLAKQYVSDEQMVQTYSADGLPEVQRLRAADLNPGLRVRVTMGTGLARSRAAREDQVLRMVEAGVLKDPELVAELLDIPTGRITPTRVYDRRLARNENLTLANAEPIVPNSWDDHAIHLQEHNNFRKTAEYLGLGEEAKIVFEHHCELHEQMEVMQLQKMMMKQQLASGLAMPAPPPPPQSGPGTPDAEDPEEPPDETASSAPSGTPARAA